MSSVLHNAILGALTVSQVQSNAFSAGNQITPGRVSAGIDPSTFFLTNGQPAGRWSSSDLATILGGSGISPTAGLYISGSNIDLPMKARVAGSTYAGAGAHQIVRGTRGLVVPTAFQASQGAPFATCDFGVAFIDADGFTGPISLLTAQNIAAQSFISKFRLGPGYATPLAGASTQIGGLQSVTVNPGIEVEHEYANGGIFPVATYIKARNPSIDVGFRSESALNTFGPLIKACSAATFYFRKMSPGGTVVAGGTAEHISFSFADCITDVQEWSASEMETAVPTLRIFGTALSWSVTATLP